MVSFDVWEKGTSLPVGVLVHAVSTEDGCHGKPYQPYLCVAAVRAISMPGARAWQIWCLENEDSRPIWTPNRPGGTFMSPKERYAKLNDFFGPMYNAITFMIPMPDPEDLTYLVFEQDKLLDTTRLNVIPHDRKTPFTPTILITHIFHFVHYTNASRLLSERVEGRRFHPLCKSCCAITPTPCHACAIPSMLG
jgi:hypothetical protein